jgi:opacity protein-like surface antigen
VWRNATHPGYGDEVTRRLLPLLVVSLALAVPAAASANVVVLSSDGNQVVAFTTAKCRKATKKAARLRFIATAKSGGYTLHVNIWQHLPPAGEAITMTYGGDGPADFSVFGPGGSWSNLNRPPNAPPGGGAIVFNAKRTRMGLGFQPAFDQAISSSVDVGGGLTCKYPKKKKKRKS